jgi:ferredoxin
MKVAHTQGTCGGVEMCVELAPDYFAVDESGLIQVLRTDVSEADLARVTDAVNECPTGALRLARDAEGAAHA